MSAKLDMIQTQQDNKYDIGQANNLTKVISNQHSKAVEPVLKFGVPSSTGLSATQRQFANVHLRNELVQETT